MMMMMMVVVMVRTWNYAMKNTRRFQNANNHNGTASVNIDMIN